MLTKISFIRKRCREVLFSLAMNPSKNNYLFCSVPIYFMKSMEIYQDIYYFYFPVDYYRGFYYCIEVKKFGDSYKVISFGFD